MSSIRAACLLLGLLLIGNAADRTAVAAEPGLTLQRSALLQLQQHPIVQGNFTQRRKLSGLPRAIESKGRFVFWRQHGLYWETLQPFYQATTFGVDDLIYWDSIDGPALEAGPKDPVQQYVSQVMLSLFSADMGELDKLFKSQWHGDRNNWSLQLLPAQTAVARVIARVQLRGGQYLRSLSVETRSGDRNTMLLDKIKTPATLSPTQCLRFSRSAEASCEAGKE